LHFQFEQATAGKSTNDTKIYMLYFLINNLRVFVSVPVFAVDVSAGSAISATEVASTIFGAIVVAFDVVGAGAVAAFVVTIFVVGTFVVAAEVVATFAVSAVVIVSVVFTAAVVGWSTPIQEIISVLLDECLINCSSVDIKSGDNNVKIFP